MSSQPTILWMSHFVSSGNQQRANIVQYSAKRLLRVYRFNYRITKLRVSATQMRRMLCMYVCENVEPKLFPKTWRLR